MIENVTVTWTEMGLLITGIATCLRSQDGSQGSPMIAAWLQQPSAITSSAVKLVRISLSGSASLMAFCSRGILVAPPQTTTWYKP